MEPYLEYGMVGAISVFFIFLGFEYFYYWRKVKEGFLKSGMKWPLNSQTELNETARTDFPKSYQMMWRNMGEAARIVFSLKSNNPTISKPLRSMRRILLAILLVMMLAFQAV